MNQKNNRVIGCDSRSMILNGKRTLLIGGEVHYSRSTPAQWSQILEQSLRDGLNVISTYCFWNFHETSRGVYDFSGQRDLGHFLTLCQDKGLYVILRLGPYCCGEWNYGGYPPYLREEEEIRIRTWNKAYLNRVEKYFEHLAAVVRPFLSNEGGPILLVQVENEYGNVAPRYGKDGERYMKWIAELAKKVGFQVPSIVCDFDWKNSGVTVPTEVSNENPPLQHLKTTDAKVETIHCLNGFSIEPGTITQFKKEHKTTPLSWTENWTAWYDTWGYQVHRRDPRNIVFSTLRFLSQGGSFWNYYMWHGGTNFGRTSMYLQTTSYGFDAPLDEFGRATIKSSLLGKMHHLLRAFETVILEGTRTLKINSEGIEMTQWNNGGQRLELWINPAGKGCTFESRRLAPQSAILMDEKGAVLFDSEKDFLSLQKINKSLWNAISTPMKWHSWKEPNFESRQNEEGTKYSLHPEEQLSLTQDRSDYCWYSAQVQIHKNGLQKLKISHGGDYFYFFLDGKMIAQSETPLQENRGSTRPCLDQEDIQIVNVLDKKESGFSHLIQFEAVQGTYRLEILAVSMGMIKGDWMISGPMEQERKGIWSKVSLNDKTIRNWVMVPGLRGERLRVGEESLAVEWGSFKPNQLMTWHQASFELPEKYLLKTVDFRLNATGLCKGFIYVNGRHIGRYWLIEAKGYGGDEIWHTPQEHGITLGPNGQSTQDCYHVPQSWLKTENRICIFEEQGGDPRKIDFEIRIQNKI